MRASVKVSLLYILHQTADPGRRPPTADYHVNWIPSAVAFSRAVPSYRYAAEPYTFAAAAV